MQWKNNQHIWTIFVGNFDKWYNKYMKYGSLWKLLVSIIVCEFAGVVGSVFTISEINGWYKGLNKPNFNPPGWIFGPVWTALFVLMAISLYLVWSKKITLKNIIIFSIQLILNVLWSLIFFGAHSPSVAFFELLMLWFAIVFTIINFYKVSKTAALLLLPYILWVSFAGVLNYFIWILN